EAFSPVGAGLITPVENDTVPRGTPDFTRIAKHVRVPIVDASVFRVSGLNWRPERCDNVSNCLDRRRHWIQLQLLKSRTGRWRALKGRRLSRASVWFTSIMLLTP